MANIDLSKLPPALQRALFEASKQQGAQPTSGGIPMDQAPMAEAPQQQAPMFQRQPGDKMDPNEAMAIIQQKMMGQQPQQSSYQMGRNQEGQLTKRVPFQMPILGPLNPILGMLGVKKTVPVQSPDYFSSIKEAGLESLLQGMNLPRKPNGEPFVSEEVYKNILSGNPDAQGKRKDYFVPIGYSEEQKGYITHNAATNEFKVVPLDRAAAKTKSNPTSGDLDKASALDRIDKTLSQINEFYDPRFTGAVQNPMQVVQQRFGVNPTKDRAKFNSAVGNLKLALAEERGKNLTEMEYAMLMEAIPDVKKSDIDFEAKMEQFMDTFGFVRQQRIKRASGLMAGAEQLYSKPDTGSKKASGKASPAAEKPVVTKPKTWAELKKQKMGGK